MHAYIVLLLTTGLRPENARALRWDHIDLDAETVAVWRSDRAGGDTKTPKSRRTLRLAWIAVDALRQRRAAQAADRLKTVNCGTTLPGVHDQDRHHARLAQHQARLPSDHPGGGPGDEWVPRELRHTFVSIMSVGVPVADIACLAGHQQTSTTELVYRRELRPVITTGVEIMDQIFSSQT